MDAARATRIGGCVHQLSSRPASTRPAGAITPRSATRPPRGRGSLGGTSLAVHDGMRATWILALALSVAVPASAQDSWSDPFPGVRHLHRVTGSQDLHALVVDLCASGVSLRGTADGERRRTVPS